MLCYSVAFLFFEALFIGSFVLGLLPLMWESLHTECMFLYDCCISNGIGSTVSEPYSKHLFPMRNTS